jgi:sugar lactone lactonase YvrE
LPTLTAPPQVVLPFIGLNNPLDVAVDSGGNLYVTDMKNKRVLKLASGSSTQTELPFTDLSAPKGVAVDNAGNVYVSDDDKRLLKLAAGTATQVEIPITRDDVAWGPDDVAVDGAGNVYITRINGWLEKLAAGSMTPTRVPNTNDATSVAVDAAGNVYTAVGNACGLDSHEYLLKIEAGTNTQTRLFTDLSCAWGVTADASGNVYVTDTTITTTKNRVVKLTAGTNTAAELPFTGLKNPLGVSVDTAGNLYVVDNGNNRILKLLAR